MSKRALLRLATSICLMVSVIFLAHITTLADEIDPTWTKLASMSQAKIYSQTVAVDGKIYAIGGANSNMDPLSSLEVYDPDTNSWTKLTPMSTPRYFVQTEVLDGKIYAIGGSTGSGTVSTTEVYDPDSNKWTQLASMSISRGRLQTEAINGEIYAIGGGNNDEVGTTIEVYKPNINKWVKLASMSQPRLCHRTEVVNGKIYAIGGYVENNFLTSTELYDPTTNSWTKLTSMSTPRYNFQTEVINGKIYAIGGANSGGQLSSMEVYDPTTNSWTSLAPMSATKMYFQTKVINGKIYAIGGNSKNENLSSTEVYDPSTDSWATLASMSAPRYGLGAEVINNKIYAIGGSRTVSYAEVYTVATSLPEASPTLIASGGNSKIDLTWDAVDKATSYTIKRSTTAGGPYTTVATDITETAYADTNVATGTTYYYIVSAVNTGTEITDSNEASAAPIADQTPPTTEAKLKVVLEVSEYLRLSVDNDLDVNTKMGWSSSDESVATVNEKGIVTALATGNTVITVKSVDGSYTDYINVLVVENADDYRLAIDLKVGETARLTADDFTNTANVTWAPMDSSIANVTTKGKVTALSKGLVLITAKDTDGNIIGRVYVRVRE